MGHTSWSSSRAASAGDLVVDDEVEALGLRDRHRGEVPPAALEGVGDHAHDRAQ
jgi:hypothetical protein